MSIGVHVEGEISIHKGDKQWGFPNAVLNRGFASLTARGNVTSTGQMVPKWLHFGTGEADPSPEDAGLESRAPATTKYRSSLSYSGRIDPTTATSYSQVTVRFDYEAGVMTGTWTELGLSYDEDYVEPFNRALVRDENGWPTPLLVLSDEPLTVYVRLRLYLQWPDGPFSLPDFPGTNFRYVLNDAAFSEDEGLWRLGLPVDMIVLRHADGTDTLRDAVYDPDAAEVSAEYLAGFDSTFGLEEISFMVDERITHIHLIPSPPISKSLDKRLKITPRLKFTQR